MNENDFCEYHELCTKSVYLTHHGHTRGLQSLQTLAAVTSFVGVGPYFANGDEFEGVTSNFNGHWGGV